MIYKIYLLILLLTSSLYADFVSGKWLYMVAEEETGNTFDLMTPWKSGFQVGIDLSIVPQDVDTLLAYTQYLNSCTIEKTHWEMSMRLLNLEIGHEINFIRKLYLRTHIGLGSLWHGQTVHNHLTEPSQEQNIRRWGLGIRAGFNSCWGLGQGFSLFADQALTAMWSRFRVIRHDVDVLKAKADFASIQPVYDTSLGVKWEQGTFAIKAGWNTYLFFNNNQSILLLKEVGSSGNLSLMGGSLEVIWGF